MHAKPTKIVRRQNSDGCQASTLLCDAPSYLGAAEGICMLVRHFLMQISMPQQVFSTEIVIRECLNNAIHHGNENDPDKRIKASVARTPDGIRIRVADEGKGFDWKETLARRHASDNECCGRGLALVKSYASRIAFNRKGNVITVEIPNQSARRSEPWPQTTA